MVFFFLNLFYFWLRWVFVAAHGLFSSCGEQGLLFVAMRRGYSSLRCTGFSLWWLLLLQGTASRHVDSVVVARRL